MTMTLGQAAKTAGKAKATILNAINDGRLSAPKDEKGRYMIEPVELNRVFPFTVGKTVTEQNTEPQLNAEKTADFIRLEVEVEQLRERLAETQTQRDEWMKQAQQLSLAPPAPAPVQAVVTPAPAQEDAGQGEKPSQKAEKTRSGGLFGFLRGNHA